MQRRCDEHLTSGYGRKQVSALRGATEVLDRQDAECESRQCGYPGTGPADLGKQEGDLESTEAVAPELGRRGQRQQSGVGQVLPAVIGLPAQQGGRQPDDLPPRLVQGEVHVGSSRAAKTETETCSSLNRNHRRRQPPKESPRPWP
jgi:hypothetical protein